MTRSLCTWLASLALFVAPSFAPPSVANPSFASAQNFRAQSQLAPVSLGARCQIAESMRNDSLAFAGLGFDPLCAAVMAHDEEIADDQKPIESAVESNPVLACDPLAFCPFADLAKDEPIDVTPHAFVGSSPVIYTLPKEAYLPYDLVKRPPVRMNWLSFTYPQSCLLSDRPVVLSPAEEEIAGSTLSASSAVTSSPSSSIDLSALIPSDEQIKFLQRVYHSMQPRLPLACWMDEIIWRGSDLLAADGPVAPWLDADRIGQELGGLSVRAFAEMQIIVRPALPVLARSVAPHQPIPAGPAKPPVVAEELAVAALVLQSAAGELEALASTLRIWSDSLEQVASAEHVNGQSRPQPLRR